jgi:hypothetical protein
MSDLASAPKLIDAPVVDLSGRLALRLAEAADALGISERKLREMLPDLPHIRHGGIVMIPVRPLERWLEEESKKETRRMERLADEIADSFNQ